MKDEEPEDPDRTRVPGLTYSETERLAQCEARELRGKANAEDLAELNWLRDKIDKRKVQRMDEDGTLWISRAGARLMKDQIAALEQAGQKIRYLEETDED